MATGAILVLSGGAFAQMPSTDSITRTKTHARDQSTMIESRTIGNAARTDTMARTTSAVPMDDNQIVQNLEQQGYHDVWVIDHSEGHVDVDYSKDGHGHKLIVDPATGRVMKD